MDVVNQKNSSFRFPGLGANADSIRLLRLLPGEQNEPIRCTLRTCHLSDDDTAYSALSYAWGLEQSTESREIYINDDSFWIFANLHDFLVQLRARRCESELWADSICINQADVREKSTQVALMGSIFSSATRVFIWLGAEADGSAEVIDQYNALSLLLGALSKKQEQEFPQLRWFYNPSTQSLRMDLSEVPGNTIRYSENFWAQTLSLLRRPYWNRVWIVQEIVLAPAEILLLCGDRVVSWSTLSSIDKYHEVLRNADEFRNWKITNFGKYLSLKESRKSRSLFSLLESFEDLECTDPRDRVYALLGLITDVHQRGIITPDYSVSRQELFLRIFVLEEPLRRYSLGVLLAHLLKLNAPKDFLPDEIGGSPDDARLRLVLSELKPTLLFKSMSMVYQGTESKSINEGKRGGRDIVFEYDVCFKEDLGLLANAGAEIFSSICTCCPISLQDIRAPTSPWAVELPLKAGDFIMQLEDEGLSTNNNDRSPEVFIVFENPPGERIESTSSGFQSAVRLSNLRAINYGCFDIADSDGTGTLSFYPARIATSRSYTISQSFSLRNDQEPHEYPKTAILSSARCGYVEEKESCVVLTPPTFSDLLLLVGVFDHKSHP